MPRPEPDEDALARSMSAAKEERVRGSLLGREQRCSMRGEATACASLMRDLARAVLARSMLGDGWGVSEAR
ncbi:hypothetical protein DRW03_24735 [Corallococcus sp. H22C18031201]|nr:hypothetical protein DRW03_24735 [Corallococcus sp. H22C18031201]